MILFSRLFTYNCMKISKSRIGTYSSGIRKYYSRAPLVLKTMQCSQMSDTKRFQHTSLSEVAENSDKNDTKSVDVEDCDFTSITKGDPMLEKKLKILMLEVEVFRQSGIRVPQNIQLDQWKQLLHSETKSARRKYLEFLFVTEKKKENKKLKKALKKSNNVPEPIQNENGHLLYSLGHNSIFHRIYDSKITEFYNYRLIRAMEFSQKLVLDCGYDEHMTNHEAQNCGKQLMLLFSDNRVHDNPFDLYMCNVNTESRSMRAFSKIIPTIYDPDFPLNITHKSYLDIFPKEKLVYLTPHTREVIREFDHDAVYIIGAIVDKGPSEPLSLAKAKREGLKMAKLPIDNYLVWGTGSSKTLPLNHMIRILLEIRSSGDWNKAFQHIPRRKVVNSEDENQLKTVKNQFFKLKPRRRY